MCSRSEGSSSKKCKLSHNLAGFQDHPRHFRGSRWVYPVLSRRSRGISIGINISPDKVCNFNCIYCQVDRSQDAGLGQDEAKAFSLAELDQELEKTVAMVQSGELFEYELFKDAPAEFRRLNDIALSGDGEPTASIHFLDVCRLCLDIKDRLSLAEMKIIVITNSSLLDKPAVREGLELLKDKGGEIWAKLDAGTAEYYRKINSSAVGFERIMKNLAATAKLMPIVIQTLFMRIDGQRPGTAEIREYADRLNEIVDAGGQIKNVQLHTIARRPRLGNVSALSNDELDAIAGEIGKISNVELQKFYGTGK